MSGPRRAGRLPGVALMALASIAAWLSYASVRAVAVGVFGTVGGSAFPLLLDTAVFASSEYYLASVRNGRPMGGFRVLAHGLIGATVGLNVSAAADGRSALFHAVPPVLFAALVELRARKELGDARAAAGAPGRIPLRLWVTSPLESFALSLWVARAASFSEQRAERERYLTARRALRIAVPGRGAARTARGLARRQLRTGSLDPAALVAAAGLDRPAADVGPDAVLRVALRAAFGAPSTDVVPAAEPVLSPRTERFVLGPFRPFPGQVDPFPATGASRPGRHGADGAQNDEDERATAVRLRGDGASYAEIGRQLGRSKSWVHATVKAANGSGGHVE